MKVPGSISLEYIGERLQSEPAERLHEWICRQGIVVKKGVSIETVTSDAVRIARLREIVLDFGRGLYALGSAYKREDTEFDLGSVYGRLCNDARAAYNVQPKKWLDNADLHSRVLIPDVVFVPSPRPNLLFSFHA